MKLNMFELVDEWVDVSADFNDFVVNLGDLMQRWTNDRFKSTRHRGLWGD